MTLEIQRYLLNGGTPETLQEEYGIKHRRHGTHPNLIQFKYSQIDSPMGERIVQECRGIILDEFDKWRVVARPFDKFFNYSQGHAAPIDWDTARVQEKMDGSLIIFYNYGGSWHVATSGMPDASGEVHGFGMSFEELFWEIWAQAGYKLPYGQEHYTLMFELTSPYNRIIVNNRDFRLTLLGVRNRRTGCELPPNIMAQQHGYNVVREFPLTSLDGVLKTFDTMDPVKQEGYVIVDGKHQRIKVKHPGYVALHHMKSAASPKAFLEVIRSGETDEFLTHFPEYEKEYLDVKDQYDHLILELITSYQMIQDIEEQKAFALVAVKSRYPGALFAIRGGKAQTIREYLASANVKLLMRVLGMKDAD